LMRSRLLTLLNALIGSVYKFLGWLRKSESYHTEKIQIRERLTLKRQKTRTQCKKYLTYLGVM